MIFDNVKNIYMMGICGTAMGSMAGILQSMGFVVSGSDQNVYPPISTMLHDLGIEIKIGYKPENLSPKPDLVIVGNVMSRSNEEVQALLDSDIPYTSLAKAMGELVIGKRNSIVCSGTHGKTTTTSMFAWVMDYLGHDPGFMVGGIPKNYETSFSKGGGDYFVIEGDEYDTAFFDKVPKFNHYKPKYVVLNGIEFDHADIYEDIGEVVSAFKGLLSRIPKDGILLYKGNDKNIESILTQSNAKRNCSFGDSDSDYHHRNISYNQNYCFFDAYKKNELLVKIKIATFGLYNVWNATAVVGMCNELGFDLEKVADALRTYEGVKRRQELIVQKGDVKVYEDFAHHPTAVGLTVEAMKDRFGSQRLICLFEPRSATSRRKIFQKAYVEAFKKSDLCYIAEPFNQDKIPLEDRFSTEELIADLRANGVNASMFKNARDVVKKIKHDLREDDKIVVMSNGGFDGIYDLLREQI
ncbi:MAG: UDP-N-acetylmuramate:L-alanyl-gamma-D-glutamyl-meso-diaminopimelate ligase [Bdellovibrionales bacterium]